MIVMVIDNAPAKLRGELTKWLLEVKPGVFVGKVSAMVRERLWDKVYDSYEADGIVGAVLLYSMNTEQGFQMEMCGEPNRRVIDINGLQLIGVNSKVLLQAEDGEGIAGGDGTSTGNRADVVGEK